MRANDYVVRAKFGAGAQLVRNCVFDEQPVREPWRRNLRGTWKGDETREKQVLNALFPVMSRDRIATLALFEIVKHQSGY